MFVSDKRRQTAYGAIEPFSRIKKDLIREVSANLALLRCEPQTAGRTNLLQEVEVSGPGEILSCALQVAALTPMDQVLVIGNSQEPQACMKGDQTTSSTFFDLCIYLPLPDYASRRVKRTHIILLHACLVSSCFSC